MDGTGYASPAGRAGYPMTDQAGELDNRLSLSVGDFPVIEDWEDGKSYIVTMEIKQVSPGEFEPVTMISSKAKSDEEEAPSAEKGAKEADGANVPTSSNPAVQRQISAMKGGY